MSRITKEIASTIAAQLVEPQVKEIKVLQNELTEVCRHYYLDRLPTGLLPAFKKWMVWFDTTSSILINGPGLPQGYKYYDIGECLPKDKNSIEVNQQEADIIIAIDGKINTKKSEKNQLKESIEITLFNLRTYKNVQDKFPEAAKYLPSQKPIPQVMIQLKDIRCKLDKANC